MEFLLIIFLIILNGFFAATEFSLVSIDREKYKMEKYAKDKKVQTLLNLTKNPSRFLATIQVGITFAGFLASASAAISISEPFGKILEATGLAFISEFSNQIAIVVGTLILSFITLVFGELVPKRIALASTEKVALLTAQPINVLSKIMKPVVFILTKSTDFITHLLGVDTEDAETRITEEEIISAIKKGRMHGVLNPTETEMLEGIFTLDDKIVKEIRTPKSRVFSVDINTDKEDMMDKVIKSGFSRIPVMENGQIIGILYLKDWFYALSRKEEKEFSIKSLLRNAYFVPDSKKIDVLYKELKVSQNHMAIVIDEYGSFSGLVTLEDILEEIVGEIFDEHDKKIHSIKSIDENEFLVDGLENIKKVNKELDLDLPSDYSDTIGGFVLGLIDDIPSEGDNPTVAYKDVVFKVEKIKGKRIKTVKIIKTPKE